MTDLKQEINQGMSIAKYQPDQSAYAIMLLALAVTDVAEALRHQNVLHIDNLGDDLG